MAHAYFDALCARGDTWAQYSLRDGVYDNSACKYDADQDALKIVIPPFYHTNSLTAAMDATTDLLPMFTDSAGPVPPDIPLKVDAEIMTVIGRVSSSAVRVTRHTHGTAAASHATGAAVFTSTNSLKSQVKVLANTSDGHSWVFIWDTRWGSSFLNCGDFNHKAFQLTSGSNNGDQIWLEPGADYFPYGGDEVAAIHCRSYNKVGGPADWTQSTGDQLGPGVPDTSIATKGFKAVHSRWTRQWVRITQRANDYDLIDMWVADEARDPVQIVVAVPCSVRPSGKFPNVVYKFWLEFNTSTDACFRTDLRTLEAWCRNIWIGKDVANLADLLIRPEAGVPPDPIEPPEPPEMNMTVNPTACEFLSPDHADATGYKLECLDEADVVKKTVNVALADCTIVAGKVHVAVNVQNLKPFGTYTTRVIMVVGAVQSLPSPESEPWERSPGGPSDVVML